MISEKNRAGETKPAGDDEKPVADAEWLFAGGGRPVGDDRKPAADAEWLFADGGRPAGDDGKPAAGAAGGGTPTVSVWLTASTARTTPVSVE